MNHHTKFDGRQSIRPWPVVLLVGVVLLAACTHPVRRLVFQPHHIEAVPPFPSGAPDLQRWWLPTDQGDVEGWLFPGRGVDAGAPGPAVLMAHGNRELIDSCRHRARMYQGMGFTVLLGEYRGYGRSAGSPSRARIADDFRRFHDRLAALPMVDADRIVFHGRSLGGAVLSELAVARPPAAVIVESTFTSIKAMAHGAPDVLLVDNYDTLAALRVFRGPILIIHGTRDRVVPVDHARELAARLPGAELRLYDFGHSDGPPDLDVYWRDIAVFLGRALDERSR